VHVLCAHTHLRKMYRLHWMWMAWKASLPWSRRPHNATLRVRLCQSTMHSHQVAKHCSQYLGQNLLITFGLKVAMHSHKILISASPLIFVKLMAIQAYTHGAGCQASLSNLLFPPSLGYDSQSLYLLGSVPATPTCRHKTTFSAIG
jgi:hypothetical protein